MEMFSIRNVRNHAKSAVRESAPDTIEALLDHQFGAQQVHSYGTCSMPEVMYRVCQNCDQYEYREDNLADHDYVDGVCWNCGAKDPNPYLGCGF